MADPKIKLEKKVLADGTQVVTVIEETKEKKEKTPEAEKAEGDNA